MNFVGYRCLLRHLILFVITGGALLCGSMSTATATEAKTADNQSAAVKNLPGPVGLSVTGASAGITTDYFARIVADRLAGSGIFSGIDDSRSADVVMPMIGADGAFSGTEFSDDSPYFLTIRVIKVVTPSFSLRMTVGMNTIWTLYRTAEKTELLHENIYSTYTGGFFEGGIIGANRVRVAMEGAERENIHIGIGMLATLDLEND